MSKAFVFDLLERVVRTFAVAFLAPVGVGWVTVRDVPSATALAWAGVIAGGTAVLALVARFIGNPDTASVLKSEVPA